jgi:uncharacterized metal-binding protein YceD (DUF177 family)
VGEEKFTRKSSEITIMTNEEVELFIRKVRQMRHNQRRLELRRSPEVLRECQRLEKEVDADLDKIFHRQLLFFSD